MASELSHPEERQVGRAAGMSLVWVRPAVAVGPPTSR